MPVPNIDPVLEENPGLEPAFIERWLQASPRVSYGTKEPRPYSSRLTLGWGFLIW